MPRVVKTIPNAQYGRDPDPWLDALFDGKLRVLNPEEWDRDQGGRWATSRSAVGSLREAARTRGVEATIALRRDRIYVQAENGHGHG